MRGCQHEHVQPRQDGIQVADRDELVGMDVGGGAAGHRADHPDHVGVEPAQEPRRLAADTARADDADDEAGGLRDRVALPVVAALVGLDAQEILAEHEHGHEHELGQRPGVDAARRGDHDILALEQAVAAGELAHPGARRLHPAQAAPSREPVGEGHRAEVVEHVRGLEQCHPAVAGGGVCDRRKQVVAGVARRRDQVGLVGDLDPRVDRGHRRQVPLLDMGGDHDAQALGHGRASARV